MSSCQIHFSAARSISDPHETPVLIIGLAKNLGQVNFKDVASNLDPRVSEEVSYRVIKAIVESVTSTLESQSVTSTLESQSVTDM